uniref:Uncharacterized protein n=1 Tax=Caenorhabditis japonica TaxID=281687 RepID=A0A8R1E1H6_CAEJA
INRNEVIHKNVRKLENKLLNEQGLRNVMKSVFPAHNLDLLDLVTVKAVTCDEKSIKFEVNVPDVETILAETCYDYGEVLNGNYVYFHLPHLVVDDNQALDPFLCDPPTVTISPHSFKCLQLQQMQSLLFLLTVDTYLSASVCFC